ncbi:hypothetical protein FS837_006220, partial [Tulasnella sp. UAMH 9824]
MIDDTSPAIGYNDNSAGQWVADDSLSWDATKLYLGTIHRGDGNARAQFNFTGVGVKVVIAAHDVPEAWTNISFFVDNTKQGDYIREGTNANQLVYNVTAFEISDLQNSTHILDIVGGQGINAMYLDYIQYTQLLPFIARNANSPYSTMQPDSSASSSPTLSAVTSTSIQRTSWTPLAPTAFSEPPRISTTGIIGVGMMVLVIVLLVANLAIWIHRRKRKATKRPRSSETALLKFYQDVSIQGEKLSQTDEEFTQVSLTGSSKRKKAKKGTSTAPRARKRRIVDETLFSETQSSVATTGTASLISTLSTSDGRMTSAEQPLQLEEKVETPKAPSRKKKVKEPPPEPTLADFAPRARNDWKIGAHVSGAGGLENAVTNAASIG